MNVRYRVLSGILPLLAGGTLQAVQEPEQRALTLRSRIFENTRTIRVLLPPGYDAPANEATRYPVFYFTDGVAAWDAWGVPTVVQDLWKTGAMPPFIVVGIDNGGSTRESVAPVRDRASEYLPYPDQTWVEAPPEPRGDRFPAFLFGEVVPLIDEAFRTMSGGRCTGLAGASYGAAAALNTALHHPGRLGFLLLESPSLHIGNGRLLADAAAAQQWPDRVYIGVGTAEGETRAAQERMLSDARALHATIQHTPPPPVALLTETAGATHWYDAWHQRLPEALTFLLSGDGAARCRSPGTPGG